MPVLSVIHPVTRTKMEPKLPDAFTNGTMIAEIPIFNPINSF